MNVEHIIKENHELKELNEKLKIELEEIKEHLKRYTAPSYKKLYYENNKEEIKQKIQEYKKTYKPTEEQKKKMGKNCIPQ